MQPASLPVVSVQVIVVGSCSASLSPDIGGIL